MCMDTIDRILSGEDIDTGEEVVSIVNSSKVYNVYGYYR